MVGASRGGGGGGMPNPYCWANPQERTTTPLPEELASAYSESALKGDLHSAADLDTARAIENADFAAARVAASRQRRGRRHLRARAAAARPVALHLLHVPLHQRRRPSRYLHHDLHRVSPSTPRVVRRRATRTHSINFSCAPSFSPPFSPARPASPPSRRHLNSHRPLSCSRPSSRVLVDLR